jgi:hypothetical protein
LRGVELTEEDILKVNSSWNLLHYREWVNGLDMSLLFSAVLLFHRLNRLYQHGQLNRIIVFQFYLMHLECLLCRLCKRNYIHSLSLSCTHVVGKNIDCEGKFRFLGVLRYKQLHLLNSYWD